MIIWWRIDSIHLSWLVSSSHTGRNGGEEWWEISTSEPVSSPKCWLISNIFFRQLTSWLVHSVRHYCKFTFSPDEYQTTHCKTWISWKKSYLPSPFPSHSPIHFFNASFITWKEREIERESKSTKKLNWNFLSTLQEKGETGGGEDGV